MVDVLDITVWATPVPQGSFIARQMGKKAYAVPANAGALKKYRNLIATRAKQAMAKRYGSPTLFAKTVPVEFDLTFIFVRPASIKPGKRALPIVRPDCDKLIRSVGDALTGAVYEDDAQVVSIVARKVYGPEEGVRIIVRRVEEIAEVVMLPLVLPVADKVRTVFDF